MDMETLFRFAAALVFTLALMGILGIILKRTGQGVRAKSGRRLKIIEALALDPKRKLLLIARDGQEHLVIVGPNGETVVETHIERPANAPSDNDDIEPI